MDFDDKIKAARQYGTALASQGVTSTFDAHYEQLRAIVGGYAPAEESTILAAFHTAWRNRLDA